MGDILIRDLPDEVVAQLDAQAAALGISRAEYLRRTVCSQAQVSRIELELADFLRFSEQFADLADPDVMDRAWR